MSDDLIVMHFLLLLTFNRHFFTRQDGDLWQRETTDWMGLSQLWYTTDLPNQSNQLWSLVGGWDSRYSTHSAQYHNEPHHETPWKSGWGE